MSDPHRMTLRPPWLTEPLPDGRTRYTRRFGRPRTLAAGETVWLVGDVPTGAEVGLNGELLGMAGQGGFAFDVTAVLNPRNDLTITTTGKIGPVAVEVRAT
jgi:hypothetical protein